MSAWELTEPARSAEEPWTKPRPSCSSSEPPASQTREPRLILHPNLLLFCSRNTTRRSFRSPVFWHATSAMIAQSRRDPAACFTCFIRSRSGASLPFKNNFAPFTNADGRESTMRLRQSHGCSLRKSGAVTRCRERSAAAWSGPATGRLSERSPRAGMAPALVPQSAAVWSRGWCRLDTGTPAAGVLRHHDDRHIQHRYYDCY